ncbi:secretion protein EspV, partial [Escherichia coli]|nr:secretion protein EspV [Escherichia coli]
MFAAKPESSQRSISGLFSPRSNGENASNKPSSGMANRIKPVVSDSQIGRYTTDSNTLKDGLCSQAHIGTQPYRPGADSPLTVRSFLQITLSNNNYKSLEHLQTRAENYLRHRKAEEKILRSTVEGLTNPESPVFKQAAWMGHLERGLWKTETRWNGNDRDQLGKEALGSEEPKPGSPFYGSRGLKLSDSARSAFSMMLCG